MNLFSHLCQAEMGALKRLQAGTAAELEALLPALLDRAFKGELQWMPLIHLARRGFANHFFGLFVFAQTEKDRLA